jgi:hypothetical protein
VFLLKSLFTNRAANFYTLSSYLRGPSLGGYHISIADIAIEDMAILRMSAEAHLRSYLLRAPTPCLALIAILDACSVKVNDGSMSTPR